MARFSKLHPCFGFLHCQPDHYRQIYNRLCEMRDNDVKAGNLTEVMKEAHNILHGKYFRDVIGTFDNAKSTEPFAHYTKFFTPERLKAIKSGEAGRLKVAGEFADRIKEGEVLVKRMMRQIQQAVGKSPLSTDPIENFDELADLFYKMDKDGMIPALTSKFSGKSYSSKIVNDQIADIASDIIPVSYTHLTLPTNREV